MIQRHISGSSINTGMEYNEVCPGDEVEDLYELLKDVQAKYPTVKAVACGAILSNYQRHRLEHVCGRLGLTVLSYLWQKERKELLEEMILEHNMDIMLVKVAGAGLQPRKHLGKRLKDLYPQLLKLHKKYGLDLCGEGGEYESLVLDAPYFRKRIEIVATKIIEDPEDPDVGNLFVLDHRVVDKEIPNATVAEAEAATPAYPRFESAHQQLNKALALSSSSSSSSSSAVPSSVDNLHQPRTSLLLARKPVKIHWKEDGFGHTELITAMGTAAGGEAESSLSAVYRAQLTEVMNRLVHTLTVIHGLRQEDIAFVHLYLQDMTMFAVANEVYCQYFQRYPPSRSCVQLALPTGGSVVAVEACILRHSYNAMLHRAESVSSSSSASSSSALQPGHNTRREVLHVQSMSQWAPLCIGPYCQANILQDFFLFVAGQIPLQPGTMTLRPHTAPARPGEGGGGVHRLSREDLLLDMTLSLRHVHRVLSVLQSDLHHLLSVIVYVNTAYSVVEGEEEEGEGEGEGGQPSSSSTKGTGGGGVSSLWTSGRVLMERLCRQNAFVGDSGVAIADAIQQHATEGNAAEDEEGEEYAEDFDAYDVDQDDQEEAEERHRKAQASAHAVLPPIIFVGVPGLPRNASCEIEVIAAKTDRVRVTGWKQVHVTEREPMTTTAADGRGATVVVNASNDVDSWPIWSSDASSVATSRRVGGEDEAEAPVPLVGQALVKTYPGTVCSGVVDVLVPCASTANENTVDVARMLAVGVSTLQRTLREDAAMRPNRLLYVKVLYDPAVVGSLVTPDMVCQWWKDAWLQCAAVAASSSAASSSSAATTAAASSLLPVASTMALPVSFLQPSTTITTPHTVALHVLFFAADAHQLETESWIKLASNHCQGS
eukprot:gene17503-12519_t